MGCFPSSCGSFVGCQGGEQRVYFSNVCTVGNLCHEIMHALGLHHEHTRRDRDQYVTIKWDNILKGECGPDRFIPRKMLNFNKSGWKTVVCLWGLKVRKRTLTSKLATTWVFLMTSNPSCTMESKSSSSSRLPHRSTGT